MNVTTGMNESVNKWACSKKCALTRKGGKKKKICNNQTQELRRHSFMEPFNVGENHPIVVNIFYYWNHHKKIG